VSPLLSDYPRYAWHMLAGVRAKMESGTAAQRARDLAPWLDLSQPRDILDVGNGSLRPQYALMRNAGHRVVGIDFVNRPGISWKRSIYKVLRRLYALQLGIPSAAMDQHGLIVGNVGILPFASRSFDLAISNAAFEHFLDVPAVLANLQRVLRPGGMIWAGVHLFTSPSGGHNVSFTQYPLRSLPPGAEPWDHLRAQRRAFTVPLNCWRKGQFLAAFAEHFEVLTHYCGLREGEQWLTSALEAELADYTRDELTCGTLVIVARKRAENSR
jgi:SAM-dependent methyltransferase